MQKRMYQNLIAQHFAENRQMLFLSGPRQVGKTTAARTYGEGQAGSTYFSWDVQNDRRLILRGAESVAAEAGLQVASAHPRLCMFDEIHKYRKWKSFIKGFFDKYEQRAQVIVTGSGKLDVYRAGGDSLMGRYFPLRMHPFSVAELVNPVLEMPTTLVRPEPGSLDNDHFEALLTFGGFPEPLLRQQETFWRRWRGLRSQQLFREDLREITRIQDLGQVETLAEILCHRAGQLTSYTNLANEINASVDSIRRWIKTLELLYYCFSVRPWYKNVARSLRKEPKYYLWDWSQATDTGSRNENFVASALLKAVHTWTDLGLGEFGLYYLRDKQKREVDLLVVRDAKPWFLVEVKSGDRNRISPALSYFQKATGAPHAFQVVMDLPFAEIDCFGYNEPVIVPARTLLAQLV